MNRRTFITGLGTSTALSTLPSTISAQWVYCGVEEIPSDEPLMDYGWDFTDFTLHGSIERYWLGTVESAHDAVFGDSPIVSREHPVENLEEIEFKNEAIRIWRCNLWHENVPTVRAMWVVDEYVWMVTTDAETPPSVIQFLFDSVHEFGEPRVPRDWGIPTEYWFD